MSKNIKFDPTPYIKQGYNNIVNTYKKLSSLVNQIKPLMVATIYRLCKDSLMLYPYITESI